MQATIVRGQESINCGISTTTHSNKPIFYLRQKQQCTGAAAAALHRTRNDSAAAGLTYLHISGIHN